MSTPINQLPTNVSNNDNNEKSVNEILKECNNDTNQISMKEPPQDNIQINENNEIKNHL